MILGFVFIGIIAGLIAAVISLLMGASFGWAFVAYMGAGNIAMLLTGLAVTLRDYSPGKSLNRATSLNFDDDYLWVDLYDGRIVGAPLAWYPRLQHASPTQRLDYELRRREIHWRGLGQTVPVTGLLGVNMRSGSEYGT